MSERISHPLVQIVLLAVYAVVMTMVAVRFPPSSLNAISMLGVPLALALAANRDIGMRCLMALVLPVCSVAVSTVTMAMVFGGY